MVTDGTKNNETILADYMEMHEKINDVFDNDLLKAVNDLVPFAKKTSPMFIWDFETLQIIDCNEEALLKYGYLREEFLQLTFGDYGQSLPAFQ